MSFSQYCSYFFTEANEQRLTDISNQIRDLKTNVLMIGWCHASNGDLAMALRSDATISRLILEQEMRDIGIVNPQISYQQREVLQEAYKKKDVFLYGNTGAGKTVLGAEVVKIKMAQWIRNSVNGTVHILTYNDYTGNTYKLFKDTFFKNMLRCKGIKIEFGTLINVLKLSRTDSNTLKASIDDYCKNLTGRHIFMVDEFEMSHLTESQFSVTESKHFDDNMILQFHVTVDDKGSREGKFGFSDFSKHGNIDFIICVSPISEMDKQSIFKPINHNTGQHKNQYIKWLKGRYRNTKKILKFIKKLQSFNQGECDLSSSSLSMENDKDVSNLPSPFQDYDPPVIWIDFDASQPESSQTVFKRIQTIISSSEPEGQVPILSITTGIIKSKQDTAFENSLMTMINTNNKRIIQPYFYQEFIGMEADIAIVPLHDKSKPSDFQFLGHNMLQCFSRARRLLIIITSYQHPTANFIWNKIPILNAAFHSGEELVQKINVNGCDESQPIIGCEKEKLDIDFKIKIVSENMRRERELRTNLPKSYYNYYCRVLSSMPSRGKYNLLFDDKVNGIVF